MQKLNLPEYDLKLKEDSGKLWVFDPFRSKYVVLTPEEQVRQQFARYLIEEKNYPSSRMVSEYHLQLNELSKRCDLLVFNSKKEPVVLVECKAPNIKISQEVFDQVARYNVVFRVKHLMVTNGMKHFCCRLSFDNGTVEFLSSIPSYNDLRL